MVDVYAAARRIIEAGLAADDSAFTPGRPVWTAESADLLEKYFVQRPDAGTGSFTRKLRGQLDGVPATAIQLMAELIYLHLLLPRDLGGTVKRKVIGAALTLLPEPVRIPADLDAVLDHGRVKAGVAYLTQRDRQIAWLVRVLQAWKALPRDEQRHALDDPWKFREILDGVPINAAYSQRNLLLNLAFPGVFPDIASNKHKKLIVAAFTHRLTTPTGDVERDLVAIRDTLNAESPDQPVHFYHPPWADRWLPSAVAAATTGQRGWLVRSARVHGRNMLDDWLADGFCSIGFTERLDGEIAGSRAQIVEQLRQAAPDLTPMQRAIMAGVLDRFHNQMSEGDIVVAGDRRGLYIGEVTGPVTRVASTDDLSNLRRAVRWANPAVPADRDELSDAARSKLAGYLSVAGLGMHTAEFAALAGIGEGDDADGGSADLDGEDAADLADLAAELPEPTTALAERLFIDREWLAETVDLLREKKQIVLYGPPGTGKTYLAQELARFLTGEADNAYRLVQFHPSYAYEDFFEGYRPRPADDGNGVGFSLEPGPFKQLVEDARADPAQPYILIIDEINRANLAKVFGELYFLLEYRDRNIALQYSPGDDFDLPPNVYLIGTMNTADRSIALVDAAMRRRFYFQSLFPGEPPLVDMLRRWLDDQQLPADRADLLDELNRRIGDRDAAVGPSYLMTSRAATADGLARIWKTAILPLLEERHVGDGVDVRARYGLDVLWKALADGGTSAATLTAVEPPEPVEETGDAPQ
ncbi:McrB family protein [Micromonospora sp. LOL_013]|uniref:McrB family protein n=1 Tax=Micromonospora sp. LOL_013 TaxID=3345414 RepID=UPI003A84ECE3